MRHLLRQMKPYCFDDIVAAIALFRPGPMENIPTYLKRRSHQEKVVYPLKELEQIPFYDSDIRKELLRHVPSFEIMEDVISIENTEN